MCVLATSFTNLYISLTVVLTSNLTINMQIKLSPVESNKLFFYFVTTLGTGLLMLLTKPLGLINTFETKEIIFFVLSLSIVTAALEPALRELRNDSSKFRRVLLVSATISPLIITVMVVAFHSIT